MAVSSVTGFLAGEVTHADGFKTLITLPKENVLKFILENDLWIAIRPSGTEPKCKFYFGVIGGSAQQENDKIEQLKASVLNTKNII